MNTIERIARQQPDTGANTVIVAFVCDLARCEVPAAKIMEEALKRFEDREEVNRAAREATRIMARQHLKD